MKGLYKQFATDENLEKSGILLDYGTTEEGKPIRIRIARAGGQNAKFQQTAEIVLKPYRRQLQNETIDPKVLEQLYRVIYARAVVIGWENVTDAEGNELAFTEENVIRVFTDLPDLFKDVREAAEKAALFKNQAREDEAGN